MGEEGSQKSVTYYFNGALAEILTKFLVSPKQQGFQPWDWKDGAEYK